MSRPFIAPGALAVGAGTCWLGASCVDTGRLPSPVGTIDAAADAVAMPAPNPDASLEGLPGPEACSDSPPTAGRTGPYAWKNVTILGGGFVTGIEFSPATGGTDVIYARTDVGGAYRWDAAQRRWTALTDWVGADQANLMGIESVAPDPVDPDVVYVAAGEYLSGGTGVILRSGDRGNTWTQHATTIPMGGNVDGRNMGERLGVDPNRTSTLYFAARSSMTRTGSVNGLWQSTDSAGTWARVATFPVTGTQDYGLDFVLFDKRSGSPGSATSTLYVGVTTCTTAGSQRSPCPTGASGLNGLYRTIDGGATWAPVPGQPTGFIPHHAAMDYAAGSLYVSFNNAWGPNNVTAGDIWKLDTSSDAWTRVTPPGGAGGFGGVSVDPSHAGTVVVTTLDRWNPDEIYRTTNGGSSWTPLGPKAVRDAAGAAWLQFDGVSPNATGWMGDIEIDPHHPARALYNTGQGIWWSDDITSSDTGGPTTWTFQDHGLEETVALDIISPSGGAHLLTAVGDLGGFRHDNLDVSPPDGMFGRPTRDSASTIFKDTTSIDFAERRPSFVVRVGTIVSGKPMHHGAYSIDGGTTWSSFGTEPLGASAGSIAVSADGAALVWAPQPASGSNGGPAYSFDRGATWLPCSGLANGSTVAADRVNPKLFYGTSRSQVVVSTDSGASFAAAATLSQGGGVLRPVFGIEGDIWLAAGNGLYHSIDAGMSFSPVAAGTIDSASAVGFGRGAACGDYPVIFLVGSANGVSGVYRSDDKGTSWRRIDDPQHQFGSIHCVSGDPRSYGRAYLGSGGRGILYGDPQ